MEVTRNLQGWPHPLGLTFLKGHHGMRWDGEWAILWVAGASMPAGKGAALESDSESPSSHSRGDWHPESKGTQQSHGWTAQPRLPAWVLPAVCWGPGLKTHPRQLPGRLTLGLEGTGSTGHVLRIYHRWQTCPSGMTLWWPGLCLPLSRSPLSTNRGG